ncbi:MAG: DMT family transporter [Desulfuromonadaceae bacterium]
MCMTYVYLAIAIVGEVAATSALKASAQFSRLLPSIIVVCGYAVAFYCLSIVLKQLPVGITYAVWAGAGVVLVALVAMLLYRQIPDLPALIGMGLIISGVAVIHLFSDTL